MIISSKNSHMSVNSLMGRLGFDRVWLHCRRCKEGYAPFDRELDINEDHKVTKGLTEVVCDFAQRMGSFEEASYMLEKYLGIQISASMIQEISEEVGKKLYEKEKEEAKDLYENQYRAISQVPENMKTGRIYIEADGTFEEHVYECANAIYPDDEIGRKRWANEIIDGFMVADKIEETVGSLKPEDYREEAVKAKVEDLKTYLDNNKDKMHYKQYKDKGYFIGSGAVEGGHKHVIQQRLKLAGMRWSRGGAQYIASLRTASKSDKWDKVTDVIYGKAG